MTPPPPSRRTFPSDVHFNDVFTPQSPSGHPLWTI